MYSSYDQSGFLLYMFFFFQAEDGIRDLVRSRGLGDVYKRQVQNHRQVHRFGHGLEVLVDAFLRRAVVVRHHGQGLSLIHI